MEENTVISPLFCIPSIGVLKTCAHAENLVIDGWENYIKQSFRNRYHIQSANGIQTLTINVAGQKGEKTPTQSIEIDYEKPWVRTHLRSIESAYRSSPFFDFYFPDIEQLLGEKKTTILDFFEAGISLWENWFQCQLNYELSKSFVGAPSKIDLRMRFKKPEDFPNPTSFPPYTQVFSDRFPFQPNLSVLDLIFNLGPEASSYFQR